MEKTEVDTTIEQIEGSINNSMEENENILTFVIPTLVIILLLKKILKYGNQNEKLEIEENETKIPKLCIFNQAVVAADAFLSDKENNTFPLDINKHCSHIPGHKHSHIYSFYTLYHKYGIYGIKKFIYYGFIHSVPLSYTIISKKELDYYRNRLIKEKKNNESLKQSNSFLKAKIEKFSEILNNEKEGRKISEDCLKESIKKLEKKLGESENKCDDLEIDNENLRRRLAHNYPSSSQQNSILDPQSSENELFNFNTYDFGIPSSSIEENEIIVSDRVDQDHCYFSDDETIVNNNENVTSVNTVPTVIFRRQEEQRQNEREANELLSDLDQRGMDDFILKIKKGKYCFRDVAISLLNQMITSDLDAVQVSIELDQFIKRCSAGKKEVLCAIVEVICNFIEKKNQKKINICALQVIQKYVALFQEYVGNATKDKIQFLTLIYNHFRTIDTIKPVFVNIIEKLYNLNIVDATSILSWYNLQDEKELKSNMSNCKAFEKFLDTINYESLKKNMKLMKEYDSYGDINDSGYFCDEEEYIDECNDLESGEHSHHEFSNDEEVEEEEIEEDRSSDSCIPCCCCNCKCSNENSLFKEKITSHVRFNFDEIPSDHLLMEGEDHSNEIIINNNDISSTSSYLSDKSFDDYDRCLLDIVEEYDEENENASFFIQDIHGEHIFSNSKNILDEDSCCSSNATDNSYPSSISSSQHQYLLEDDDNEKEEDHCSNEIMSKFGDCHAKTIQNYTEDDHNDTNNNFSDNSLVEEEEIVEEIEKEYLIIKNYDIVDSDQKEDYEEYEEYENKESYVEVCFENEEERKENDMINDENEEEDEGVEICFENDSEDSESSEEEDEEDEDDDDEEEEDEEEEDNYQKNNFDGENDHELSEEEEEEEENRNESKNDDDNGDEIEICFEYDSHHPEENIIYHNGNEILEEEDSEEEEDDDDDDDEDEEDDDNDKDDDEEEEDYDYNYDIGNDEENDDELEICFGYEEDDEPEQETNSNITMINDSCSSHSSHSNSSRMIKYRRTNSDNEICDYISEHDTKIHGKNRFRLDGSDLAHGNENGELECESDSGIGFEMFFEETSDPETEIYSDESEEEDNTYDSESESESDDGSDTEFDDDRIEKIANFCSNFPTDTANLDKHSEAPRNHSSSKHHKKSHHSVPSETNNNDDRIENENINCNIDINGTENDNKNINENSNGNSNSNSNANSNANANENEIVLSKENNNGISSDLDEVMYDSDIDVVLCSSDCTIEISDDQNEINCYQSTKINEEENEGENNANLYPDLMKIKEDGQKKYHIKNIKKYHCFTKKDNNIHEKLMVLWMNKPEIKYELENIIGKYSDTDSINAKQTKKTRHPKFIEKSIKKNKKSAKKSSKKHSLKNKNFLNCSSLRNII